MIDHKRYTALGLPNHALLLIVDRKEGTGMLMDLSGEKEVAASLERHRTEAKDFPPGAMMTYHLLDLVKIGDYFGVTLPGIPEMESVAILYRIHPDGHLYDKVYRPSGGEFRISQMENLTLLSDSRYFGHIDTQDRLVIVSISENRLPAN